jgi:hypothetical protein
LPREEREWFAAPRRDPEVLDGCSCASCHRSTLERGPRPDQHPGAPPNHQAPVETLHFNLDFSLMDEEEVVMRPLNGANWMASVECSETMTKEINHSHYY